MALAPGTRLGPYEVVSPLGAGGMGEVYRARDVRLGRTVAVKVLPADLSGRGERLKRFEREARAASALNHPNIVTILDAGSSDGTAWIAMEHVEGDTLRRLVADGPLPLKKLLAVATQVAEGLARAHATGIVHRDLKPENVMVARDGVVKILDFGLAKLIEPSHEDGGASSAPTLSAVTEAGVVLGTVDYMSPEQTRGLPLDFRSDLFAFGSMLYEMATGRRPFARPSAPETMTAIIREEPEPLATSAPSTPVPLRWIIERCLAKDPEERYAATRDLARDVARLRDGLAEESSTSARPPAAPARGDRGRGWRAAALAALALAAVLALALGAVLRRPAVVDSSGFRFVPLAAEPGDESWPSWSPDGRSVVYAAEVGAVRQLFTRSLDAALPSQLTRTSWDCQRPFWSGDGARVYFSDGSVYQGDLWSVAATGGEPQRVLKDASVATLSPDGKTLAFLRGKGGSRTLWLASTGTLTPLQYRTPPFPEVFNRSQGIDFSRDGARIAVLLERQRSRSFETELWVVPLPSGTPRLALGAVRDLPDGRVSWMPNGRHLILAGERPDDPGSHLYVADLLRDTLLPVTSGTVDETAPAASPSGDAIAFAAGSEDGDLVRVPLDGSRGEMLLASARNETHPSWSPSGRQLAYVTNARGVPEIWLRSLDEGWARPVTPRTPQAAGWTRVAKPSFSPDGQSVVHEVHAGPLHTIWISSLADGRGVPLDDESRDQHSPAWSPDGRWVAYQRLQSGAWELVKRPSGGGAAVHLAAADPGGGAQTAWSPKGDWLAYVREEKLLLVSPEDGARQRTVCAWAPRAFGFSPDGSLLYAVRRAAGRWTLVAFDVRSGSPEKETTLDLPPTATLAGFSVHPDGRSFATGVVIARHDIWLLQGFRPPGAWLGGF